MGRSQISNALAALAGGLEKIANYRGMREEKEEERAYQDRRDEANRGFQTTLAERGYKHAETMQEKSQLFSADEGQKTRDHALVMFDKQEAAANKRHAESLAVQREQIAAAAARANKGDKDVDLGKRLRVFELEYEGAGKGYRSLAEQMNAEIKAIDENKLMKPEEAKAAKAKISEQYGPALEEARQAESAALDKMQYELKMKPDFRNVTAQVDDGEVRQVGSAAPASGGSSGGVNKQEAERAASAAAAQFASSGQPIPEESVLVERFMATGAMDKATAVLAARRARALAAQGRR